MGRWVRSVRSMELLRLAREKQQPAETTHAPLKPVFLCFRRCTPVTARAKVSHEYVPDLSLCVVDDVNTPLPHSKNYPQQTTQISECSRSGCRPTGRVKVFFSRI
jgi:hypothetical protein